MTTETNSVLNNVKEAFAPVTDAFKSMQNLEVPEAAREFVKKTAGTAKERAADLYAGSEKATDVIETAVANSVSEAAKISRTIQQALYQDVEAFFAGIDKLASAKSLNEAVQIQSMSPSRAATANPPLAPRRDRSHRSSRQACRGRCQDRPGQLRQGLYQDRLNGFPRQLCCVSSKARLMRAFFFRPFDHRRRSTWRRGAVRTP